MTVGGFRFEEATHSYFLGTEKLPGTTSILSLLGGYESVPKKLLEVAAARGTAVHKVTELDDAGTLDYASLSDELTGYLLGWHKFKAEKKPIMLDAEVAGYHPRLKYAGTRDRRIVIGKKVGILDIKSSYMLMPTTGPQTAAYKEIWNETAPKDEQVKHRWGLKLTKDGDYQLHEYTDALDLNTFISCLNVWRFMQRHNPKKIQTIEEYQNEY